MNFHLSMHCNSQISGYFISERSYQFDFWGTNSLPASTFKLQKFHLKCLIMIGLDWSLDATFRSIRKAHVPQVSDTGLSELISLSYFIHIQFTNVAKVHLKFDRDNLQCWSSDGILVFRYSSFPFLLPFSKSGLLLSKELIFTIQGRKSNRELLQQ